MDFKKKREIRAVCSLKLTRVQGLYVRVGRICSTVFNREYEFIHKLLFCLLGCSAIMCTQYCFALQKRKKPGDWARVLESTQTKFDFCITI